MLPTIVPPKRERVSRPATSERKHYYLSSSNLLKQTSTQSDYGAKRGDFKTFRSSTHSLKSTEHRSNSLPVAITHTKRTKLKASDDRNGTSYEEYRRGSTSSLPGFYPDLASPLGFMIGTSDSPSPLFSEKESNTKAKNKQRIRFLKHFFFDRWVHKVFISIPFGILVSAITHGFTGNPYIFICYVLLASLFLIYPILCLIYAVYKCFLPYYQLFLYSPNSLEELDSASESEKEESKSTTTKSEVEANSSTKSERKSPKLNKKLQRKPSTRRASTLPAIKEGKADEEEGGSEEEGGGRARREGQQQQTKYITLRMDMERA